MEAAACDVTAPAAIYEIGGQRYDTTAVGFADAIAAAHTAHRRPRCLCRPEGVDMYVARLGEGLIVKRMPETGGQHAPGCPSYEPPAEFTGLGQVLGSAISEDPATGITTLKLDFPLTRIPGRAAMPPAGASGDSVATHGTRLSLRGLLHYLWDQAELTRWHPGFAGKRTWATVRRHLLRAAEHKMARGDALPARLHVPEPFTPDDRDAINARRIAQWRHAVAAPGKPQQLMIVIGEVKEIVPARYGYKAIIKHMPDQAFALDEALYRRLGRRFEPALALWGATEDIRMMMIATFGIAASGIPSIVELCLMPVTRQWLPVEDEFERRLIERLVSDGRSFVKGLRYNMDSADVVASATLTDGGGDAPALFIERLRTPDDRARRDVISDALPGWRWDPSIEDFPSFPAPTQQT